jgi:bifunctional NMN adenylyltransferase/nudix hydrolase
MSLPQKREQTMKVREEHTELGVIIGRFQSHDMHSGHLELIDSVLALHKRVLILLGSTPAVLVTRNNPLDYHTRMLMIQEDYPDLMILPLYDMPSNEDWSRSVDERILEVSHMGSATLYGSRDGFMPFYNGKFSVVELDSTYPHLSASEVRKAASEEVRAHSEFRRGVVYAAFHRHPVAFPTIDAAIIKEQYIACPSASLGGRSHKFIALGRKKNDKPGLWRFPGGFVDPTDGTLEQTVRREVHEEMNVDINDPIYIGSHQVDDWRYRKEVDGIMTSLFIAPYLCGGLKAGDDLVEAEWFDLDSLDPKILVEGHRPLFELVRKYLKRED